MHRHGFRFAVFPFLILAIITVFPVVAMSIVAVYILPQSGISPLIRMAVIGSGALLSLLIILGITLQIRKRIGLHLLSVFSESSGPTGKPRSGKRAGFDILGFCGISAEITSMLDFMRNREQELENQINEWNIAHEKTVERLRQASDQLIISEKMAALGGLVSGVTHEINTPLSIGVTAASFLNERSRSIIREWDEQQLTQDNLERFLKDAEEISRIIHTNLSQAAKILVSLKQVAADQQLDERRVFNLGDYVQDILLSLKHRLKSEGHTAALVANEPVLVNSYPGAIAQSVNNLVLNSIIHGFKGIKGGTITIELSRENSNVVMRYTDSGRGMNEEEQHRVFDPFYTTKRGKGGTGMGMNIVYNLIVEKLSGTIHVFSPENGGAGFVLTFPDLQK